ncbi:MAG TPA: aminoacyl-tRNA hydrolase [Verrucomicrobiae bacterium]|nr:aminoacyl-tRNA hydrolase [Verrucomicrobiae bacterium]
MENLRLIVGLGNPGAKYTRTRHNIGFQLVDQLAQQWRANWAQEKRFQSALARLERSGSIILLCQPQTFMNASGEAVAAVAGFYRVPNNSLLIALDDADLPLGEIRLRERGSSGGHHGLESIEQHLGTRDFARLRIGIGRTADGRREITDYVLTPFTTAEIPLVKRVLGAASAQVECWLDAGIGKAMSQFNGVVKDSA